MSLKDQVLEIIRNEASTGAAIYLNAACLVLKIRPEELDKARLSEVAPIMERSFEKHFNQEMAKRIASKIAAL